ncbi:MAG: type II/IV secretion system protein [Tissierellia bacterium]|nr:type II/IV secretion system protein [Tissierellia bacterium]
MFINFKSKDKLKKDSEENLKVDDIDAISFIDELIKEAINLKASDIHIETYLDEIRIRYRIYGKLKTVDKLNAKYHSILLTRIKLMSGMDIAEKRLPQDGRIDFYYNNRLIDLRISTIPTVDGEKAVIRILDSEKFKVDKNNLGISKEDIKIIDNLLKYENGMILVTGPTGCGKTTTLYALIQELNKDDVNIVTIEDPVEYKIRGINQIQINEKAGIYFNNTLRSILRQDPDIILVGEMRDIDTANIGIRASITGHKVFTTLHTNDAYSTILRLMDMGVEDYLIKSSVKGVISQRLVRRLCPNCRQKVKIKEDEKYLFEQFFDKDKINYKYEAVGCEKCIDGYIGRLAIMEILPMNKEILLNINKDIDIKKLEKIGEKYNIKTIMEKGLGYVLEGRVSLEDIMEISFSDV